MEKILLIFVVMTSIVFSGCSSSNKKNIKSLGLSASDLVGVWVTDSHSEWINGECRYKKTVTWLIADSLLTERIHTVTFVGNGKSVETTSDESYTYTYTYEPSRNEIMCNGVVYQIQSFMFLDIYKEDEMVVLVSQTTPKGKLSEFPMKFHRPRKE